MADLLAFLLGESVVNKLTAKLSLWLLLFITSAILVAVALYAYS
jgi:hypothetical protein